MQRIYMTGLAPRKGHDDDAAFDLRAEFDSLVQAHGTTVVPCGLRIDIPERYVGLVCSRSGLALNHGVFVLNAPGIIDPGYQGDVMAILMNVSDRDFRISAGDRIAQLLILETPDIVLVQNENAFDHTSSRGEGGFGSTGKD